MLQSTLPEKALIKLRSKGPRNEEEIDASGLYWLIYGLLKDLLQGKSCQKTTDFLNQFFSLTEEVEKTDWNEIGTGYFHIKERVKERFSISLIFLLSEIAIYGKPTYLNQLIENKNIRSTLTFDDVLPRVPNFGIISHPEMLTPCTAFNRLNRHCPKLVNLILDTDHLPVFTPLHDNHHKKGKKRAHEEREASQKRPLKKGRVEEEIKVEKEKNPSEKKGFFDGCRIS